MARIHATLVLLLSLSLILSGCVDRGRLKAEVLDAVLKHENVRSYRFSGTLELSVPAGAEPREPASGLGSLLPAVGTYSWQGVASFDPPRAEAEIHLAAPNREPARIPVFIQHSRLVFSLPGAGGDRHFAVDLDGLAKRRGLEGASPLSGAGARFARAMAAFVEALDTARFDEPADTDGGRRIVASFGEGESEAFGRFLDAALPAAKAALSAYLPEEDPGSGPLEGAARSGYELRGPAVFTFDLNEDGYLEQFRAEVRVAWRREDGTTGGVNVRLVSRHDDINADPPFGLEMPEDAIPFNDLLNLLP